MSYTPESLAELIKGDCRDTRVLALTIAIGAGWLNEIIKEYLQGNLFLNECTSLTELPENLEVHHLNISACTALTTLPKGLKVNGDLTADNCTSLVSLPENLYVGGYYCVLYKCTSLESLPKGFYAKGNLDIRHCKLIKDLPNDIKIGRDFYIEYTPIVDFSRSALRAIDCKGSVYSVYPY
jgi:hypothetical protein